MAKTHKKTKITAILLAMIMCTTIVSPSFAQTDDDTAAELTVEAEGSTDSLSGMSRDNIYSTYYNKYKDETKPDKEIAINANDYVGTAADEVSGNEPEIEVKNYEGEKDCLVWTNDYGDVTYEFNVAESGIYNMELLYYPIKGAGTSVEIGFLIDGEYPFTAAQTFTLDRYWMDETAIKKDSKDNDLRPAQTEYDCWVTYPIKDKEGLFNNPYYFYLTEGKHTVTVRGIKLNIALKSMTFKNYDELEAYTAPSQSDIDGTPALSTTSLNDIGSSTIFIQGEANAYKTASTLYATYDRTSYLTNPSHPTKQRYNTVGAATWNKATQAITWNFTVPADGYYRFNVKARQNTMRGFNSNRRVYIDGVVPNEALDDIKFPYSTHWSNQTFQTEDGEDIYVYLEAGEHSLTMEAIPGDIGEVMQRLDDVVYTLNKYYRRILMITGPDPDEYNDYYVDTQIPELIPTFEKVIEQLKTERENIKILSGQTADAAALQTMAVYLQRMVDERDLIPVMASTLKDSISAVSAWMRDYRDQPLEVDYIEVATVHENFSNSNTNFFEDVAYGFSAFMGSFFEDYTVLSEGTAKSLDVWVSLGRDQATVVKELVDSDFNANSGGIEASINLVQGSILEATLAGKGPEIALFIGGDFPIQLAARDLLVDLTQFKDYNDVVSSRFTDSISTLYTYNGGVYGLPVEQYFPMMFYRTDILEELGIDNPPETWDELINITPTIQRAYLKVGLIQPTSNLSSSVFDAGDTFAMLMLQTGQNMYTDDLSKTTFDTQASVDAFTQWTKFYTVYDFDQTYDAFSRFRTGEMPLLIQNYTFYNQLSVAAPEIKGLWSFTQVPGTIQEDGTVTHTTNSASSGAVIFNKVSDQQAAWSFIKWFTSTETQVEYGRTIEALMGPMGRFATANTEALSQLPWSTAEYNKISAQMAETQEIPIIPASYATTRHIKNAFRSVVNDAGNPRYSLSSYNRDINAEIERKNEELQAFNNR